METKAITNIASPALDKLEEVTSRLVPVISDMELHSSALLSMRGKLLPLRSKVDEEGFKMAGKVSAAVQKYQQALAAELASLPVNSKGKFDNPEAYDGLKSPQDVAIKVYGYSATTAGHLVAWGKERADENAPAALKEMPLSNYGAIKGADRKEVMKAIQSGEITSETSQKDLKEFASKHPGKTKTGKARLVTTYTIYRGGTMEEAPGGAVTEDDFKANVEAQDGKAMKFEEFKYSPSDAPEKSLNGRRYVVVYKDLSAVVFTLIPTYKVEEAKAPHVQRAVEFEMGMVKRFMESHPGTSEEDAISTLRELGMM